MTTVGIPRGMLFYEFYPMWRAYFHALGVAQATSQQPSRRVVDEGILCAVDEACLPVKVFLGHCLDMSRRCDMLFVPRMVSVEPGAYTCPKLLGLPDMVRAVPGTAPVLTAVVDYTKRRFAAFGAAIEIGEKLGVSRTRSARAHAIAVARHRQFRARLEREEGWFAGACDGAAGYRVQAARRQAPGPREARDPREAPDRREARDRRARILVLGHSYVINDAAINLGIKEHIERMGARAIAPDSVPESVANRHAAFLPKRLFWTYEKRLFGSAHYCVENGLCDGIIQMMSFGCGPDSLISELIRREAGRKRVPYMAMVVDEHTGEAGAVTRLEAYLDMLCSRGMAHS
ncbi:MAG: acyl-CoA dehydratase activase-related protein [Ignavibacteriales bacterium]